MFLQSKQKQHYPNQILQYLVKLLLNHLHPSLLSFFLSDEKELAALENIFIDTVYYLIKSGNEENVSLAKAKVWIKSFIQQRQGEEII